MGKGGLIMRKDGEGHACSFHRWEEDASSPKAFFPLDEAESQLGPHRFCVWALLGNHAHLGQLLLAVHQPYSSEIGVGRR